MTRNLKNRIYKLENAMSAQAEDGIDEEELTAMEKYMRMINAPVKVIKPSKKKCTLEEAEAAYKFIMTGK